MRGMGMIDHHRHSPAGQWASAAPVPAGAHEAPRLPAQEHAWEPLAQDAGGDLLRLLAYVVRYRRLLVMLVAAGLAGALAVTMMTVPKYRATAQLEVLVPSARVFQDIEITSETGDVRAFLTAREKLTSRSLAHRVVLELGLGDREDFLFAGTGFLPFDIVVRVFGRLGGAQVAAYSQQERMRLAVDRLLANLTVSLIPGTSLLSITYTDRRPEYARDIANQMAQGFIDQRVDRAGDTSEQARKFMQGQVEQVKERLQRSEEALLDYARKAGIAVTGSGDSLIAANLADINKALAGAIQESLDYGRLVQQIDAGQGAGLQQVLESEGLERLRGRLAELNADYRQKLVLFKPGFPEMQQLRSQMRELEKQVHLGVEAITGSIRLKHSETVAKVEDLKRKLSELEVEQAAYQDKNIRYTILKREVDSNRAQYESLVSKLNEVAVGSELKSRNAAIADPAVLPLLAYSPWLPLNLAIGLALSLISGAAAIYLLELLGNTFTTPEQVEKELRLPILGIHPAIEEGEFGQAVRDPQSALSNSYRSLGTSLQFSGEHGAPRILLVTSSEPSEGKSTTTFRLAEDFAALGASVLAIDADLRKPTLHRAFGVGNTIGLSNVLTRTVTRVDMPRLIKPARAHVDIMTAGRIPPSPADLLSSPRMGLMLQRLSRRYDIVLIDSPPVGGLPDAPILARLAEATLFVVSFHQVPRKAARAALRRVRAAGANVAGAAFTRFPVHAPGYDYRYLNSGHGENARDMSETARDPVLSAHGGASSFVSVPDRMVDDLRSISNRIRPAP